MAIAIAACESAGVTIDSAIKIHVDAELSTVVVKAAKGDTSGG